MTYTQLAAAAVTGAIVLDMVLRTRLVRRKVFWVSYAIIVFFQLVSNGVLTGSGTVHYDGGFILGDSNPEQGVPPFLGSGRIAFAPVEDLLFGFAMLLGSQVLWIYAGRRGLQREPRSGPPIWQRGGD
jgi:hypothetical protein